MGLYPPRAVERAMKVQEVILRAISAGYSRWLLDVNSEVLRLQAIKNKVFYLMSG